MVILYYFNKNLKLCTTLPRFIVRSFWKSSNDFDSNINLERKVKF